MMNPGVSKPQIDVGSLIVRSAETLGRWALGRFMDAPMQNTALGVVAVAMTFSVTNALYWQPGAHPAPLFGVERQVMNIQDAPVAVTSPLPPHPLEMAVSRAERNARPAPVQQPVPAVSPVLPGNIVASDGVSVTNQALASAQEVLKSMGFFSGKVDGYYGPVTAEAIRAFEANAGLPPKGALTPQIIALILKAPSEPAASAPPVVTQSAPAEPARSRNPSEAPVAHATAERSASAQPPSSVDEVSTQDILTQISRSAAQRSAPSSVMPPVQPAAQDPVVDRELVEKVQRALASLGFYNQAIDGIAGDSTAKAIREFENFKSFDLTGRITPELLDWLESAGAQI